MRKLMLLAGLTLLACNAVADTIIFDLSPSEFNTQMQTGSGYMQGISTTKDVNISGFGFYMWMPAADHLKFTIWNDDATTVLYSQTQSYNVFFNQKWVYTDPFDFTLLAGHHYWLGFMAEKGGEYLGYINPAYNYGKNGITALPTHVYCLGYANPDCGSPLGSQIALRIVNGGVVTPEPSTLMLLGTSGAGLFGVLRRRISR